MRGPVHAPRAVYCATFMPLATGTRVGNFEVLGTIGAGGMGEVYRARDVRLNREVAVKILPDAFARDPDRLARFEREAQALAALNDPHIAQIYGVEESNDVQALVMELVEGEDLAARVARGPIPLGDALPIARQIAGALEAAHERGIVHRDLKPANVKVTDDGRVKLLDFGLAKAMEPMAEVSSLDAMNTPTLSARATELGMILGTAAYMAPEQARGKPVDRRADVWAFGVLLYEMLTGRQAFPGTDSSDVLAAVLRDTPPLEALPPGTPPAIHRLLRRCLEKDPARRLDSMAAVRLEIDEASTPATLPPPAPPSQVPTLAWIALPVVVLLAAFAGYLLRGAAPQQERAVTRIAIAPAAHAPLEMDDGSPDIALSTDGKRVIYRGLRTDDEGRRLKAFQLVSRPLDSFEAAPLPALGHYPSAPFASPDGLWLGFETVIESRASAVLARVPTAGGPMEVVCDLAAYGQLRGAGWDRSDRIVFGVARIATGLLRVPAAGGTPEVLTTPDQEAGEQSHRWPEVLPGDAGVLFTIVRAGGFDVAVLPAGATTWRTLLRGGTHPRYLPTGHVVYASDGVLNGVGFDLSRLEVTTEPVRLVDGVVSKASGAANYALSAAGALAYVPGGPQERLSRLVWLGRDGTTESLPLEPRKYSRLAVAPDGRRIAAALQEGGAGAIWIYDAELGSFTRLTPRGESVHTPQWSPDGRRIAYWSETGRGLFTIAADGSDRPARLTRDETAVQFPGAWSPDGRVAFVQQPSLDLLAVPVTPPHDVRPIARGPGANVEPAFSPDGRWVAFVAFDARVPELVVGPAAGSDRVWPIAPNGRYPAWSADAREVVFHDGGAIKRVPIDPVSGRPAGRPEQVLTLPARISEPRPLNPSPDGRRFLMLERLDEQARFSEIRVVLNWIEEVRSKMAAPNR
jgi:eukaryotic-like serine/threonine-protein kinase